MVPSTSTSSAGTGNASTSDPSGEASPDELGILSVTGAKGKRKSSEIMDLFDDVKSETPRSHGAVSSDWNALPLLKKVMLETARK